MLTKLVTFGILAVSFLPSLCPAAETPKSKLSTDIRFDDLMVRGQRHSPFGATASVEDEKKIPALVDFRKDFNDRIQSSRSGR